MLLPLLVIIIVKMITGFSGVRFFSSFLGFYPPPPNEAFHCFYYASGHTWLSLNSTKVESQYDASRTRDSPTVPACLVNSVPAVCAFGNVDVLGKPDPRTYMGSTNLAAILHAAAVLLKVDSGWDWFITLSAVDYPLITQDEQRRSPPQRSKYEYLRGKILDVLPDYRKDAEDHLSKAVKLNPSLVDAWLCLSNCIWKKGDLPSAKNCLTLALNKYQNKKILCQLSMLERRMAQGADNAAEIVEESIKHAKDAIMLDVKDGNSWYNLGNACLTCFFVTGAWDYNKLLESLKAYQNAEKDESMSSNPDLYFNSATVHRYLENYERALSGFEAAASRDPGLNASEEVRKIVNLLDKLENLLRGQTKAKRLVSLTSSLAAVDLNPAYRRTTTDSLVGGLNKNIAIVGKVLFFVKHENVAPLYYVVCDSNQICYVLSVYGLRDEAIKEGDQVTLLDPTYHYVDFSWKGKLYQFKSVRVDFLQQLLVNGKALSAVQAVKASIHAQHKP